MELGSGLSVRKIKWVNAKGEIIVSDSETNHTEVNALIGVISSLRMLVRKVKWVNAKGEIIVSNSETDTEVNALIGGLGLLGIITELTLQLEANSRTIIESREDLNDANMVGDLKHMLKHETPHIITYWRPDLGTYRVQMFTHVGADEILPTTAPAFQATGRYSYLTPVDDQIASMLRGLIAAWDEDEADESAAADILNAGQHSHFHHILLVF